MAYLVRRTGDRVEIRESRATPRGPRARLLASFKGALTPSVLEAAAAKASRPFDRRQLVRKARSRGIPIASGSCEPEARALLARLRRADAIDPVMTTLLRQALEYAPAGDVPDRLADVSEWIGATAEERGAALRDLLDTYDRIVTSRPARLLRPKATFPRFSSTINAA